MTVFKYTQHFLAALVLLVLGSANAVMAQDTSGTDPRLRLAYEEFHPYSFTAEDGQPHGVTIDVMRKIARSAGYQLEFVKSDNPAHALRMIADGRADSTSLLALTPERLAVGLPTSVLGSFELRAFVHADTPFEQITDLASLRIGVVGGSYALAGAAQIPFAQVVEFSKNDDLVLPLLTGEIDAIVSASDSFLARLREAEIEHQVRMLGPALISSPYGFVIAPDRPDMQAALNTAIEATLTPANLDVLHEVWFGRSRTVMDHPLFWWAVLAVALSVALLIYFWRRSVMFKRSADTLVKQNSANTLLVSALNSMAASIVIYDDKMKAVHWNSGFASSFPSLINEIKSGKTMRDLMEKSYRDGSVNTDMTEEQLQQHLDLQIEKVHTQTSLPRTVYAKDGTVYEARDFRLGLNHFASIRVDVSRLEQQQNTILEQAKRLEAANDQLSEFAAIAAHDLRSPLIKQKMLMTMMAQDLEDAQSHLPDSLRRFWDKLEKSGDQMGALIEDLLEYAQADTTEVETHEIDPSNVLENVADFVGPKEGFTIEIAPDMPPVHVHMTAFTTVMRNLISNAVKHHTGAEGRIRVSCIRDDRAVRFCVQDDGPGVPDQHKDSIFVPFKRLSSQTAGSGLGLAYIKKTVEHWGGSVSVTDAPGGGSIFSVTVPDLAQSQPRMKLVG